MPDKQPTKFWEIKTEAGSGPGKLKATLLFYGLITMWPDDWYAEDKSAYEIAEELKALAAEGEIEHITARINSPGGSAFGGLAICNILRNWPAPVTTHVDGLAGSAASIIFSAGDERVMPSNTLLFVHRASGMAWGNAGEMEKMADDLKQIDKAILATYREITGLPDDELQALMDNESWISAQQAKEMGFATSIERLPIAASMHGNRLLVNGLEIDPEAARLPLTDEARAALFTAEALAAATADEAEEPTEEPTDEQPADEPAEDPAEEPEETADAEPEADAEAEAEEVPAAAPAVDAVADERARIRAIDDLAKKCPGSAALAEQAKFDTPMTPEAFAVALVNGGFAGRAAQLAALTADADAVNGVLPTQQVTSEEKARIDNLVNLASQK